MKDESKQKTKPDLITAKLIQSNATRVDTQCQRPVRPDLTDLLQISQDHADLADLAAKDYQCQPPVSRFDCDNVAGQAS